MAVIIVGRAITISGTNTERRQELIYKTYTKNEAKILRATSFTIAKLEGAINKWIAIE